MTDVRVPTLGESVTEATVATWFKQPGDTVAILCPNSHEMLESHYSVPMAGAVLNAMNIRLDAGTLSFILAHGEARVLFYDCLLYTSDAADE